MNDKVVFCLIVATLVGGTFGLSMFMIGSYYDNSITISYDFCKSQGHDSVKLFGGIYSPHYNKVKCSSSFNGEYVEEVFNVEKTFWGLREVEK